MRRNAELAVIASFVGLMGILIICVLMIADSRMKSEVTEEPVQETVKVEAQTENHTHDWKEVSIEAAALIETKELQAVASEGVPVIYLTRYRSEQNGSNKDKYVAYDAEFNDVIICADMPNSKIEIEYISEGKPRLEVYQHGNPKCSICEATLISYELKTYKFCIPEGTLLIHWE